jgi:formate dehydrogenase major subunit
LNGQAVHQVGLPYHWGYKGLVKGDVVNDLIALSQEPNVRIMETKALLCNVFAGRQSAEHNAVHSARDSQDGGHQTWQHGVSENQQ